MFKELNYLLPIDTKNPINWSHPLAQGMQACYIGMPNNVGGNTFYDLVGLSNGNLTNMGNGNNGWRRTTAPGQFADILFDGTAGYVALCSGVGGPEWPKLQLFGNMSMFAIYNTTTVASTRDIASDFNQGSNSSNWGFQLGAISANQNIRWANTVILIGNITLQPNTWYFGGWTRYGSTSAWNSELYLNGMPDKISIGTTGTNPQGSATPASIGQHGTRGLTFFSGHIAAVVFWNRRLYPEEWQSLYNISRAGWIGLINRISIFSKLFNTQSQYFWSLVSSNKLPFILRVG